MYVIMVAREERTTTQSMMSHGLRMAASGLRKKPLASICVIWMVGVREGERDRQTDRQTDRRTESERKWEDCKHLQNQFHKCEYDEE